MENLLLPHSRKRLSKGTLVTPVSIDTPQKLIAVDDIGAVAARVFAAPARFDRQTIPLLSDIRSAREQATIIGRVQGRNVRASKLPAVLARFVLGRDFYHIFRRLETTANWDRAEIEQLRAIKPGPLAFEDWVLTISGTFNRSQ
ncbi:MAG: hypothetical protein JO159_03900 [Acidobacteria bacterium]|nr:hypothetical protein [Acidobacteriota bacterium]